MRPHLPPGEHLVDPSTVDVLAITCPECGAQRGQPCPGVPPLKRHAHTQRRLAAYASAPRLRAVPRTPPPPADQPPTKAHA